MIVQVSPLVESGAVDACLEADVDHLVVPVATDDRPGSVSVDRATDLLATVPAGHTGVVSTTADDVDVVLEKARSIEPDVLCVAADRMELPPADLFDVREGLPAGTDLMRSITVEGRGVVYPAMALHSLVDWLVLESNPPDETEDHEFDRPHPWEVCADIVDELATPCILGGDVTPATVSEAIETVRPAGVALSLERGGAAPVEAETIETFVANARETAPAE